jgi:FkbM family methyltransferase
LFHAHFYGSWKPKVQNIDSLAKAKNWIYGKGKQILKRQFGLTTVDKKYFMKANEVVDYLQRKGLKIEVVYDIGAYVGDWTLQLTSFHPNVSAILFEPNTLHNQNLRKVSQNVYNVLLGSKDIELPFYSIGGTGDSVFLENTEHYKGIEPIIVRTTTLDHLVARDKLRLPDLVKIDCQGSEAEIILGGAKVLKHAKALIVETSLFELNTGGSRIESILDVSRKLGFSPIAIAGCNFRNEELVQIDLVLFNTSHSQNDKANSQVR